MSKGFTFFIVVIILFFTGSCEVDDICTKEILTPKLILTFHDASDIETRKEVDTLTVWAANKENFYNKTKTDSIAIPLDMNNDVVHYNFVSNSILDTFQIHYDRKDVFVSRSCGYKMNFTLLNETELTQNWVHDFEIKTQNIENEQTVHIQIYH